MGDEGAESVTRCEMGDEGEELVTRGEISDEKTAHIREKKQSAQ